MCAQVLHHSSHEMPDSQFTTLQTTPHCHQKTSMLSKQVVHMLRELHVNQERTSMQAKRPQAKLAKFPPTFLGSKN